jgi:membrane protein YdbS with pleckstrin-like domain
MKCRACSAEVPAESTFCPKCGQKLDAAAGARPAADTRSDQVRFGEAMAASRGPADEVEADIWEGTFSPKSMIGTWIAVGFLTIAAIVLGVLLQPTAAVWGWIALGVVLLWAFVGLLLAYRRFSVRYRLTSQRLFHERGLLRRVIDRVENIDMDDITFEQGPIERMLGVGSIRIKSSDRTDPDLWIVGVDQVRDVAAKIDNARRREQVRRSVRIDQV